MRHLAALAATLAITALPSMAQASPWITLGRLDAMSTAPRTQCDQRLINHYVSSKPVFYPSSVQLQSTGNGLLVFSGDFSTLSTLSAGEAAFRDAAKVMSETSSLPMGALAPPPPPPGWKLVTLNGQQLYVAPPPPYTTQDPTNPLVAFGPPPAGYTQDPTDVSRAFRLTTTGAREYVALSRYQLQTAPVPPAPPGPLAPVLGKGMTVKVQVGGSTGLTFNVDFIDAAGLVQGRGFGVSKAGLRNFELQESCPL